MKGLRIIIVMVIVALVLSGWASQGRALAEAATDLTSAIAATGEDAAGSKCPEASDHQAHHDHPSSDHGANCCHLTPPALELYSASSSSPRWVMSEDLVAADPDSATGIRVSPTLRPPRG